MRQSYNATLILLSCSLLKQTNKDFESSGRKKKSSLRADKWLSTDCHGYLLKQTIKHSKISEERKFFAVLWCAELTVREGGKDFLPILMDPEKQGEEPRKVYVTSRWPIHNLWGGATMLLSFVHQAQHSPCSPLSTKKKAKKCINLNSSSPKLALFISSRYQIAAADFKVRLWGVFYCCCF